MLDERASEGRLRRRSPRVYPPGALETVLRVLPVIVICGLFTYYGLFGRAKCVTGEVMQAARVSLHEMQNRTLEKELVQIPVYPGAEDVKRWSEAPPDAGETLLGSIAFVTSDSKAEVYSFYEKALAGNGWVQDFANSSLSSYKWAWEDKSGGVPWGQLLDLKIQSSATPMGKRTYAVLDLMRFPLSIPLYPDASSVTSKIVHEKCDHRETTLSYVTIATDKEIEAYYKTLLAESGWIDTEDGSKRTDAAPGILFRTYNPGITTLFVSTHPKAQGFTEVVLIIGEFVLGDI